MNDSFSRRLQNLGPQLNKFPKSYGDKLYFTLSSINAADTNGVMNSPGNVIGIQDMRLQQSGAAYTDVGFLNGSLAYKIDKKIDDGYPKTGIIGNWSAGTVAKCLTGAGVNAYKTAEASICNMAYKLE